MASDYKFPLKDGPTLVQEYQATFSDLLRESDFSSPKKDRWQRFYLAILDYLLEITPDQLIVGPPVGDFELGYPEVHDESAFLMKLTLTMSKVMITCGVEDFKIRDVTEPKPRRCLRMASALLNLIYFRSERLEAYDKIKEENKSVMEQRSTLINANDDLQRKINNIKAARAEQEPEIKKLEEEVTVMKERLNQWSKDAEVHRKKKTESSNKIAEMKSTLAQLKESLAQAKEEGVKLSGMIVQSPERMKAETERMHKQLAALKRDKEQRRDKVLSYKQQNQQRTESDTNCDFALKQIRAIEAEVNKQKEEMGEIKKVRESTQACKDELCNLSAKENQLKWVIQTKQDKLSKLNLQQQSKASLLSTIDQTRQEIAKLQAHNTSEAQQKLQLEREIQALQQQDSREDQDHLQLLATKKELLNKLCQELDNYHSSVGTWWKKVDDAAKLC